MLNYDRLNLIEELVKFYLEISSHFWFAVDEEDIRHSVIKQLDLIEKFGYEINKKHDKT